VNEYPSYTTVVARGDLYVPIRCDWSLHGFWNETELSDGEDTYDAAKRIAVDRAKSDALCYKVPV
jgi:hypothetical protein